MKVIELPGFESSPFASFLSFLDNKKISKLNSNEFQENSDKFIIIARLDGLSYLSSSHKPLDKSKLIMALNETCLTSLRQNKSVLVLDNSLEGMFFQEQIFQQFYSELKRESIDPENVIILTENISLSEYHQNWLCLNEYKKGIKIFFYHAFMNWMTFAWQKNIKSSSSSLIEFKNNQIYDIQNLTEKEYNFLCLNNMPKTHRLLTALVLHKEKVLTNGISSFADLKSPNSYLKQEIDLSSQNIEKYYSNNASALDCLKDFINTTPLVVDGESGSTDFRKNRVTQINFSLFTKTHFSIVTESESTHGQMVRFTEKCLKPLICFHPFIVIGNPFTLKTLRAFGFKTFSSYIDETYDEVCDTNLRFDFAMNSILRLAKMSKLDLAKLIYQLKPVLEHNFYHAVNDLPEICRQIHNDVRRYIICRLSGEQNISDGKLWINFEDDIETNDPQIGLPISNSSKLYLPTVKTSKPKLAIISHLNSSGGTVISKCLASMHKISLLSEIHPWGSYLGNGNFHPLIQYLKWHDKGDLLKFLEENHSDLACSKFSQIIEILVNHATSLNHQLVIRDWSYIDYFDGAGHPIPYRSVIHNALVDNFELNVAITTRHPIDTWLSMTASGFAKNISFDKFIFGYWNFAKYASVNGFFKYEDFVIAPDIMLKNICQKMNISFDKSYSQRWFDYTNITGDSGRKSGKISPRKRREIDQSLMNKFVNNKYYLDSIKMLDYI